MVVTKNMPSLKFYHDLNWGEMRWFSFPWKFIPCFDAVNIVLTGPAFGAKCPWLDRRGFNFPITFYLSTQQQMSTWRKTMVSIVTRKGTGSPWFQTQWLLIGGESWSPFSLSVRKLLAPENPGLGMTRFGHIRRIFDSDGRGTVLIEYTSLPCHGAGAYLFKMLPLWPSFRIWNLLCLFNPWITNGGQYPAVKRRHNHCCQLSRPFD